MKKLLFVLSLFTVLGASAQNMRLNAYALYAFDDAVDSYYSNTSYFNGTVKGGLLWGGGLEFMLHPQYGLELTYLRMDTKAPVTYYSNQPPAGVKSNTLDLDINYALIGGNRYKAFSPVVEGFGGLQLGAAFLKATRPAMGGFVGENSETATKFAWSIRGGVNIFPGGKASKVGLKLQVGLLSCVQSAGGGLFFGTGGAGAGISTYSSAYQFNLGGGLVFKFGK
jgi:hypothetical protein